MIPQNASTSVSPSSVDPQAADTLGALGVSPATAQLLRYFVLRPDGSPHRRHLQRILGLGSRSIDRDLARLVALGALDRIPDGRLVRYRVNSRSRLWGAVSVLIATGANPASIVRDALRGIEGISAAFVFGSVASDSADEDSDVDVFVVETQHLDRRALHLQLFQAGALLGREVNAIRYTAQSLADRLGDAHHPAARFIRGVFGGPKCWVAGGAAALLPLATAAGVASFDMSHASWNCE